MDRSGLGRTVALGVVAFVATILVLGGLLAVVGRSPGDGGASGSPTAGAAVSATPSVGSASPSAGSTPSPSPTASPTPSEGQSPSAVEEQAVLIETSQQQN